MRKRGREGENIGKSVGEKRKMRRETRRKEMK